MEQKSWWKAITYPARIDYLSFQNNELVFVLAIEKLLDLEVPAKATWMRMLLCELNRIHSHLVWLGTSSPRARRDLDVLVRVPRARDDPRPLRARHRLPHAHAVLPDRRAGRGHPAGLLSRVPQVRRLDAQGARRLRRAAQQERDLGRAHARASASSRPRTRSRSGSRGRCCAPPASTGICAGRSVPLYDRVDFRVPVYHGRRRLRPLPRPDRGDARVDAIVEQCLDRLERMEGEPWIADDRKVVLPPRRSSTPRWSR